MVTITQIETGVEALFAGWTATIPGEAAPVPVQTFISMPAAEVYRNEYFPAITVCIEDMRHEAELEEGETVVHLSSTGPTGPGVAGVNTRVKPAPWYRVRVVIELFVSRYAQPFATLLQRITTVRDPRGVVRLNGQDYWFFFVGSTDLTEADGDRVIYRRRWVYDLLVDIDPGYAVESVPRVEEIALDFYQKQNGLAAPPGEEIRFTDTTSSWTPKNEE